MKKRFRRIIASMLLGIVSVTSVPAIDVLAQINDADDAVYVLAGSDFQNPDGPEAGAVQVGKILDKVSEIYPEMDGFLFAGDYDCYTINDEMDTEAGITNLMSAVQGCYSNLNYENSFLVQGNHDYYAAEGLATSGEHDQDAYGVYIIHEDDYMNTNDNEARIKKASEGLSAYLDDKVKAGYSKPVFVVSHLPLHFSHRTNSQGDALHANYLIDAMNEAGLEGLNIIYMYGHDHGLGYDNYLGGNAVYFQKGEEIPVPTSETSCEYETLAFTYMNAGFIGYFCDIYPNSFSQVDATLLTMTVFTIEDDEVTVNRYNENGLYNMKNAGSFVDADNNGSYGHKVSDTVRTSPQTISQTFPALESVLIDEKELTAYDPLEKEYKIFVRNTEDIPEVEVSVEAGMECELTQATTESKKAVASVTNGNITNTYTFIFTNEADSLPLGEYPTYADVKNISVNGEAIYNFYPEVKNYSVYVPDIAEAEITAETPEGVDVTIAKYDTYAVVRVESDDHAREYRIDFKTPPKSDDFSSEELNTDIWTVNNPDETHYEMTENGFEITSQMGQFYGTGEDNYVVNYLSQPAEGDWEAVVVLNHAITGGQPYHQFGIAAMQDEDNFVGVKYECNDWNDGAWEGITNVVEDEGISSSDVLDQSIVSDFVNSGNRHDIYYKIRKEGNEYQLSVSVDGTNYSDMGTHSIELENVELVIYAYNGLGSKKDGSAINATEEPVLVKNVQITDLTSYKQPERTSITIGASEDGTVTKLKGTSSFYQYGGGIVREPSEDSEDPEGADGEIFGWIEPGYYLLFDVYVEKSGYYTVAPRAASDGSEGNLYRYQLESDGEFLCCFEHGVTGGWKEWVTQEEKLIYLEEGKHTFRLLYHSDAINVNYLEFTYTPVEEPEKLPYTDVDENDWFYNSVYWAYENRITAGTTPTLFTPDGKCTRAEIVTFLWRAAGSPEPSTDTSTFADIKSNDYYYKAVLWAVERGITYGETSVRFAPDKQCTRVEIVTFLWRGAGSVDSTLDECVFTDVQTNGYYYEAVLWAVENQITSGQTPVLFGTNAVCTRAEAVTFIFRANK